MALPNLMCIIKNEFYNTIKLSVPGIHNVSNALACISLCFSYGISKESIAKALLEFTGAHRRFEFMGKYNDANIFDDYGHHPAEILATVNGLKNIKHNNWWYFNHILIVEQKIC